jgi:hypothetical protein
MKVIGVLMVLLGLVSLAAFWPPILIAYLIFGGMIMLAR